MKKRLRIVVLGAALLELVGCRPPLADKGPGSVVQAPMQRRGLSKEIQPERSAPVSKTEVQQKLAQLHTPFIANHGQRDARVKFYAHTFGGTVFATQEGKLVYALPAARQDQSGPASDKSQTTQNRSKAQNSHSTPYPPHSGNAVVLTEELVETTPQAVTGEGRVPTQVNVFHGNDSTKWQRHVPTYDQVSLGEVYEGVEVKLKASGNTVEKLFYVRAGAAPQRIKVKVSGGQGLQVNERGELEIRTGLGAVRFSRPVAYQEAEGKKELVEVAYVVEGEEYGFAVGTYDRSKELVIDPILAATLLWNSINERRTI